MERRQIKENIKQGLLLTSQLTQDIRCYILKLLLLWNLADKKSDKVTWRDILVRVHCNELNPPQNNKSTTIV